MRVNTGGAQAMLRRLAERLRRAPAATAQNAAPRIEEALKEAVAESGAKTDSIKVSVTDAGVTVTASPRIIAKARENGEIEEWKDIIREEARAAIKP